MLWRACEERKNLKKKNKMKNKSLKINELAGMGRRFVILEIDSQADFLPLYVFFLLSFFLV